jgi:hypothetical protein
MVLSTTKRTSSISSISNRSSGGGSKKAGLPYQIGKTHASMLAIPRVPLARYQLQLVNLRSIARPVGFRSGSAYGLKSIS